MTESSPNRQKTLWEKEKLLVTSNFSFSHSVFKRIVLHTRKNQGLYGKGLSIPEKIVQIGINLHCSMLEVFIGDDNYIDWRFIDITGNRYLQYIDRMSWCQLGFCIDSNPSPLDAIGNTTDFYRSHMSRSYYIFYAV